jgi:hypothetical protein
MKKIIPILVGLLVFGYSFDARAGLLYQPTRYFINSGLVGYWAFNPSDWGATAIVDRSGQGNNGAVQSTPQRTPGKIGQGISFNAAAQYVSVNDHASLDLITSGSVSIWVSPRTINTTSGQILLNKGDLINFSDTAYSMYVNTNGTIAFEISSEAASNAATSNTVLSPNIWYNVTGTWDADFVYIYVNGIFEAKTAKTVTVQNSSGHLNYGRPATNSSNNPFSGRLDELRVYNRTLTNDEIKRLYNVGSSVVNASQAGKVTSGLAAYWSFDGRDASSHAKITVIDRSGNGNMGTIFNATTSPFGLGKLGQAFTADGTDDYVKTSYAPNITSATSFSLSVWFKTSGVALADEVTSSLKTGGAYIILATVNGACVDETYITWGVRDDGGSDTSHACTSQSFNDGKWHHVVGILDRSKAQTLLYVDGTLQGTASASAIDGIDLSGNPFFIGARNGDGTPGLHFPGTIDEVRMYTRAITNDEIKRLYNEGASVVNTSQTSKLTSGLVGYWTFDGQDMSKGGSNTWAIDRSGQGNNGRLMNTATTSVRVSGKLGQSLKFDGTDDHVSIASILGSPANVTLSAWVNLKHSDPSFSTVISIGDYVQITMDNPTSDPDIGTAGYFWDSAVERRTETNLNLADTGWHHLAYTVDGSGNVQKFYVDGVLKATTVHAGPIVWTGRGASTIIGRDGQSSANFFNGEIDEVRVYNRVLGPDEIKRLYAMGQ